MVKNLSTNKLNSPYELLFENPFLHIENLNVILKYFIDACEMLALRMFSHPLLP